MKAQPNIKAQNKTLFLMLLVTCLAAFSAAHSTANAQAATSQTAVAATASRVFPPIEDTGTYAGVHAPPTVFRDTIIRFRFISVNRSGVTSPSRTFALVDRTGHAVNAKGYRVGGMYEAS